jgi:hypothetical protein
MMKNVTLSVDEALLARAREKLRVSGKTVNQEFREHMARVAGDDAQLAADIELFERTAGQGNSNGWKFNREELYERR